jgi:hypothetical protein
VIGVTRDTFVIKGNDLYKDAKESILGTKLLWPCRPIRDAGISETQKRKKKSRQNRTE